MYPMLMRPILLEKVWGGDRLARFGKQVRPGTKVGESWELADLAATSTGGAGGGAVASTVRNGPFTGRSLRQIITQQGAAFLGAARAGADGGYPLLLKYLDASENLSIQVHPSSAYASSHPGALVKSECWYILAAEPGAVIYNGLKAGTTRATFEKAIKSGTVVDCMNAVKVTPGECYNLPSGTCHALGAGVVCLEVQTASDTTFRVFDWGRSGRELHVQQALECIDFDSAPAAPVRPQDAPAETPFLVTPDFELTFARVGAEGLPLSGHCGPFAIVAGRGTLEHWMKGYRPERIGAGTTGYIPPQVPIASKIIGEAAAPLECILVKALART
jgi:mannose-6-phosphate isomerase